jgi:hypothetical protein
VTPWSRGLDSPSLRILAGVSLHQLRGADREITGLLAATLTELGIAFPAPGSEAAHEALARITARRALRGEVTPRELAAWAHQVFGHHLPLAEPLAASTTCTTRSNTRARPRSR